MEGLTISAIMLISATSFQKCSSTCAALSKILVMPSFFFCSSWTLEPNYDYIYLYYVSVNSVMPLLSPLQFGCDHVFLNW